MLPRLNYLSFCLEKVRAFYDEFVPADRIESTGNFQDYWFEYAG